MKQLALTVNLKNDRQLIRLYRSYHRNPWPEVVRSLKQVGVLQMKIWIKGRRLFMLVEATDDFDPNVDFARYLSLDPKCQEWENIMTQLQEPVAEAAGGEKWTMMENIFELDPTR